MKRRNNPVALAVGIALIVVGIVPFIGIVTLPTTAAALVIAASAVVLGLRRGSIGGVALAIWLVAQAVSLLITLDIPSLGSILSVLAVVAGVLILLER